MQTLSGWHKCGIQVVETGDMTGGRWQNPFEKSLAEDWMVEKFPENYTDMVACFFPPDFMSILESIDLKPKIIMGGRGTGKSHILRMLSIQSVVNRIGLKQTRGQLSSLKIHLADYSERYFGVYLKSTIFTPLSKTNITFLSDDQLKGLFEHLFNMQLCISIVDGLRFLFAHCDDVDGSKELLVCQKLTDRFKDVIHAETFDDVLNCLDSQVELIQQIVKNFPWDKDFSKFEGQIHFTTCPEFILGVFNIIRNVVLGDRVLFVLLDEYEELDHYQQVFINQLVRRRQMTFRIASAIMGIKTVEYQAGKELVEIHDYDPIIPLHFEALTRKKTSYRRLAKNVFVNRLTVYGGYKSKDPVKLLPSPTYEDEGITKHQINKELDKIRQELIKKAVKNSSRYWKNFVGHYSEAAVFRILRDLGKDKLYAGFDEYVSISSGIVRQFILLCREAFALAHAQGIPLEAGGKNAKIPPRLQSEAAESVSARQLNLAFSINIPSGQGTLLTRLVNDLGRILQAKLYYSSEPQANRFEIIGAEKLAATENTIPRDIFENGLKMPHFLSELAFKPKQPQYPLSLTFSLNGIFAPLLKIPPEKRWPTPIRVGELRGLCSDDLREETVSNIIGEIRGKRRRRHDQTERTIRTHPSQSDMFTQPIGLSNCPVTGYGCNRNLMEQMIQASRPAAFLAIPFDESSWVVDARRWIKSSLVDHLNTRCVDVNDFPNLGVILCKVCSCVRQMPIGIFEITELNSNVVFELGMATRPGKINFMLVHKNHIPSHYKKDFPPPPLGGIEYINYPLSENGILEVLRSKMKPSIDLPATAGANSACWVLRGNCPAEETAHKPNQIVIGLPYRVDPSFFGQVQTTIESIPMPNMNWKPLSVAKTLGEICQICVNIRESGFCIIDTTSNDPSMLLALGIAFGRDKKFIQLHDKSLTPERPISDLRQWAIEYANTVDLKDQLEKELRRRMSQK